MRVVFLGNHTVGIHALRALAEQDEVVGVVAHPPDPEDGVRYGSVYEFARGRGWGVIRAKAKERPVHDFIACSKPDFLWVTDYRYLLPASLLALAPLGAVNLHPSLLPKYRGRAPLNWAILHGETRLGLTAHFVDEGCDTGDIIAQVTFSLSEEQDVGDALSILYPLYESLTREVLAFFRVGNVPRVPQDHSQATVYPRRKPEDGKIDWHQPAASIRNLVRAVAAPYPGAFTTVNGERLTVWSARLAADMSSDAAPGSIVDEGPQGIAVQCGEGVLLLNRIKGKVPPAALQPGCRLGT